MQSPISLLDESGPDPFFFLKNPLSTYSSKGSKTIFLSFGGSKTANLELEILENIGCSVIIVPDTRDKVLGWLETAECLATREPHPNPQSDFSLGSDEKWVLAKKLRIISDSIPWWSKGILKIDNTYTLETAPFYEWIETQCGAMGLSPEETHIDIVKIDVSQKLERGLIFSMLDAGFRPSAILVKWSESPDTDLPTRMTALHLHNAGYKLLGTKDNKFFYWFTEADVYGICSFEIPNTEAISVGNPLVHVISAQVTREFIKDSSMQIVIQKTSTDGIGNILKGLISAFGIHNDAVVECNPSYIYGNYDTVLDDALIFKEGSQKQLEYFYTYRLLIHQSEEHLQHTVGYHYTQNNGCNNKKLNRLFSLSSHIDWNYEPSLICDEVRERIFRSIDRIRFKDVVWHEVERLRNEIGSKTPSLAISVRTWKSPHEENIKNPYSFEGYKQVIEGVLEKNPEVQQVILSIDNEAYLEDYLKLLESKNISVFTLKKAENINPLQFAAVKMLVLSGCDYLVGHRISTFSELIFWFSKCKIKVSPVF